MVYIDIFIVCSAIGFWGLFIWMLVVFNPLKYKKCPKCKGTGFIKKEE